ncbi:chromosome segregation protein [Theileria orientalis strain Shintoku]|uniref:Structural maintenance of chromosomes protein n=1 Tax=Theileria orientalis strain Shintoku TaxID=869250 RepID=J4DAQ4_THEOR|nr:chromosome segregation protein [Theileria orientalis strain Shintoku]BAM42130.1 chromosome segregation protein [Theileria orientalis strain Shintoku]|eukprot:XP_009692431.1 chromosome segregation protein [Theileria orientalis strain Shintoku]
MYIEYVILDGFKSYSTRTVIGPLDPHFNAVTGLNGSGKSNVLDSLCFVFGISDLSTVRATKLDELIYKQGQAGITRASVTIIINNNQPNSPLMHPYNTMKEITITRQIAIGGKNRYFINNHPATPKNIFDFYNTARMNINNARFLIMQGRVTKVVNMKPKELLELIEEASGTRIYENKKTVALRLIKRKDEKMQEIEKIIKDDISPMMQKLKSDKDDFLKYSNVKDEYDRLKKIQAYLQYSYYKESMEKLEESYRSKKDEMENNLKSVKDMDQLIKSMSEKLEQEQKTLSSTQKQVEAYNLRVDTVNKAISKLKSNKKITEKDYKELLDAMEETSKEIETHTASLSEFGQVDAFNEFAKKVELDRKKLKELQQLANTGGKVGQMSQLKSKLSSCISELENSERVVAHLEQEIRKNELKLKEYNESKSSYDAKMEEINERKSQLGRRIQQINKQLAEHGQGDVVADLQGKLRKMREKRERLEQELCMNEQELKKHRVQVKTVGDATGYHGQIFDVLGLNELGISYSVPIHVLVGYKLSYLVAMNSKHAKSLFKLNNFASSSKKVTIVPLEDIKVNYLLTEEDLRQIKATLSVGKEDERRVLGYWEVFEYEEKFRKLAQYVSGNCVFCNKDSDAKSIAYSKELRKRFATATLQGDRYDTSGTMSGGGNKYLNETLKTVSMLRSAQRELEEADREVSKLNDQLAQCKSMTDELYDLKSKHELCTSDLLSLQMRLKGGEYYTVLERINSSKAQLETKMSRMSELREKREQYEQELASLSKSNEGDLEGKIKLIKESLKKASVQLELLKEQNLKKSTLEHQINSNKQELENKKMQKQSLEEMKMSQEEEIKQKEEELKKLKKELEGENSNLSSVQSVIEKTIKDKEKLASSVDEMNLSIKQLEYDLETCEKDINEYQVKMAKLEIENPYVVSPDPELLEGAHLSSRTSIMDSHRTTSSNRESSRSSRNENTGESAPDGSGRLDPGKETSREGPTMGMARSDSNQGEGSRSNSRRDSLKDSSRRETSRDSSRREQGNVKRDLAHVNAKLERLQKLKEKLSRRINQKAQQMYDNIQHEYNDLINKMSKVQNDRNKIEKTIEQLDRKKQQSINEIFTKVNDHFAKIFSLLLNNATCKLVPADSKDINSGILMKICFNNVWKNSLSELSGGQRSLLALSLILAMLKVKPAPVYILDEIDAALDLSHTQNIGKMVKQQFQYSQFIIISLKEGMFSNANTLFKVKFLNGHSVISRHTSSAAAGGAASNAVLTNGATNTLETGGADGVSEHDRNGLNDARGVNHGSSQNGEVHHTRKKSKKK